MLEIVYNDTAREKILILNMTCHNLVIHDTLRFVKQVLNKLKKENNVKVKIKC